jgi:hypothetical protein
MLCIEGEHFFHSDAMCQDLGDNHLSAEDGVVFQFARHEKSVRHPRRSGHRFLFRLDNELEKSAGASNITATLH